MFRKLTKMNLMCWAPVGATYNKDANSF